MFGLIVDLGYLLGYLSAAAGWSTVRLRFFTITSVPNFRAPLASGLDPLRRPSTTTNKPWPFVVSNDSTSGSGLNSSANPWQPWQASVKTNAELVAFWKTTLDNAPPVKRHPEANRLGSDKGYPVNSGKVWSR